MTRMRNVGFLVATLGLSLALATPARAQLQGMPVYFSPKGGTGITIDGDFGRVASYEQGGQTFPDHPYAIGGRAYLGFPIVPITIGVGAATYNPNISTLQTETQFMGSLAYKIFGSSVLPIAISLQTGAGYLKLGNGTNAAKTVSVPVGLGFALNLPTPGASLEPWVAGRAQINATSTGGNGTSASETRVGIGVSGGITLGLPMGLGLHVAVDWSSFNAKPSSAILNDQENLRQVVLGVGVHYAIKLPGFGVPLVPGV